MENSPQSELQVLPVAEGTSISGSLHFNDKSSSKRRSLPKLALDKLRRPSHFGAKKSPLESRQENESSSQESAPKTPSSPESDAEEKQRTDSSPSERRKSSVGIIVSTAKTKVQTKVQKLIKSHRIVIRQKGKEAKVEENISVKLWTDKFELDLPEEITRDKSEIECLRRTNIEGATREIMTRVSSEMSMESSRASILEVVTEITITCDPENENSSQSEEVQVIRWADEVTENVQHISTTVNTDTSDQVEGLNSTSSLQHNLPHTSNFENINSYTVSLKEEDPKKPIGKRALLCQQITANFEARRQQEEQSRILTESRRGFLPPF